jgi:DNA-binding Lrp family transcriptional regulator
LCRLYDEGRGNFFTARLPLAQTTLAKKLGLSRQWVGELVHRLEQTGWIEHYSPKLPDGTNGSTIFTIGPQLKRLLITLAKSNRRQSPTKAAANTRWQFSPSTEEKKINLARQKEKEPPPERILVKIPLLKAWMERGNTDIV